MLKRGKHVILLVFVVLSVVTLGLSLVLPVFKKPPYQSNLMMRNFAEGNCRSVEKLLMGYYAESRNRETEDVLTAFVTYIIGLKNSPYSITAPVEPYILGDELSFHFLSLPHKLESANPVLIAYTSRVKTDSPTIYRGTLFLYGKKIIPLVVPEYVVKRIIGWDAVENSTPDFWLWPERSHYLLSKSLKESEQNKPK